MPFIQFQFRRGTAAEWSAANPVLASGEMAIETDTKKFKIGDGATPWNSLVYTSNVVNSIGDILDVDTAGAVDGSLLIYNDSINKWNASTSLSGQNMEGGEY